MDIKDITGLGEPLAKLVEVVASATGRISRSYFAKKDADAKAYEIRKLAEALNDSKKLLGDATYTKEGLTLTATNQPEVLSASPQLEERSLARTSYQEAKKQLNIESVVQHAAEELRDKETVSDEPVNQDWISRFFNITENISDEDMQALWGKILAGEVSRPRSYSLRTLDVLKNFTKEEAEVFAKVAQAALRGADKAFILRPKSDTAYLETEFNIKFSDILLLGEIGVLIPTELLNNSSATIRKVTSIVEYGKHGIAVARDANQPKIEIPVFLFTTIGTELLPLIDVVPKMSYVHLYASHFKDKAISVHFGKIQKKEGDLYTLSDIEDITPTA